MEKTPFSEEALRRREYHSTHGFILYAHVNDQILDEIISLPPIPVDRKQYLELYGGLLDNVAQESPSGVSLFMAVRQLNNSMVSPLGRNLSSFCHRFGVTDEDIKLTEGKSIFNHGFGDLEFPWFFAAALANAVTYSFMDAKTLSEDQHRAFTLSDWANIVGTGWFSELAQSMAFAPNNTYGAFGNNPNNYRRNALQLKLGYETSDGSASQLFDVSPQLEPEESLTYTTATLVDAVKKHLHTRLRNARNSVGCPGARRATTIPLEVATTITHVQRLIETQAIEIDAERSTEAKVRVQAKWSAIDKSLAVLAVKLDQYDSLYGTPRLVTTPTVEIVHRREPPVDALRTAA